MPPMRKRLVLLVLGVVAAVLGWRWVANHGPITELDELYPIEYMGV